MQDEKPTSPREISLGTKDDITLTICEDDTAPKKGSLFRIDADYGDSASNPNIGEQRARKTATSLMYALASTAVAKNYTLVDTIFNSPPSEPLQVMGKVRSITIVLKHKENKGSCENLHTIFKPVLKQMKVQIPKDTSNAEMNSYADKLLSERLFASHQRGNLDKNLNN